MGIDIEGVNEKRNFKENLPTGSLRYSHNKFKKIAFNPTTMP